MAEKESGGLTKQVLKGGLTIPKLKIATLQTDETF
jgi:hypothetical protein